MNLDKNVVLVTGGASGIGLALAEKFAKAGSEVILCGRNEAKLAAVKAKNPSFHIRVCDVAKPEERIALRDWAVTTFPKLNVLVNNAGVMRMVKLDQPEDWNVGRQEIAINLEAPIHLSTLFSAHLRAQPKAAIVQVTSGLAFVPMAIFPIYCATKAGLHSFALSLRHQLTGSSVAVIEIAPPHVNTDLMAPGANTAGMPLDAFIDAAVAQLVEGKLEITCGFSEKGSQATRPERDALFAMINGAAH